jgi:hypothetical protein
MNRGGQPKARTQVEKPLVKYICINGLKISPQVTVYSTYNCLIPFHILIFSVLYMLDHETLLILPFFEEKSFSLKTR